MADEAIVVEGLRKQYGELTAVGGIDLRVASGEVFALLGPNGAGKTTTVEILEGYRRRDAGTVSVLGLDPERAGPSLRARIGIVLQGGAVFGELSVEELVRHFAEFYADPLDLEVVLTMTGLADLRGRRCGVLSGGQQRRVDLALGVIGNPELIFLDEPTTGFDPAARRQAWEVVRELTSLGRTVLLTTHYLDEAEALSDRVGVIAGGRLLEVAPPQDLGGRRAAEARVSFLATGGLAGLALPPGATRDADGLVTLTTAEPTRLVAELASAAAGIGVAELPALAVTRPSLEEIYLRLVAEAET